MAGLVPAIHAFGRRVTRENGALFDNLARKNAARERICFFPLPVSAGRE
jgi:hypothetical protein